MSTPKQILITINSYIDEQKISPTLRELCALTGIKSTSTMYSRLKRLEEFGYIEKLDKSPRSIRVTDYGKEIIGRKGGTA